MSIRRIPGSEIFVVEGGQPLEVVFEVGGEYAAAAYRHRGNWHLLAYPEIVELREEWRAGAELESLLKGRGKVVSVAAGAEPSHPAIELSEAGDVSGAWIARGAPEKALRQRPRRRRRTSGGSAGDGDVSVETVRRTPHLDAPEKIVKSPGSEFTVAVYVDTKELRAGETGEGIELDLPPDIESIDVGVLLELTGPFELTEGSEFRHLTISRHEEESARLEFKLRVTAGGEETERAAIGALFTLRGRSCGHVARVWDWRADAAAAPLLDAQSQAPVSMPLHVKGDQPDLSIFVTAPVKNGTDFKCAVQAPALEGYEEPTEAREFAVPADGKEFMDGLIAALTDEGSDAEERFLSLKVIGQQAWEAAPPNVQEVLWKLIDANLPPKTIYVATVEPNLPWELMIPRRFDGSQPSELGPLGVEFAIGRWTRTDSQAPPSSLKVDRSFVVVPKYSGGRQLAFQAELQLIEEKLCGERVEPAKRKDLDRRFREDRASLLHFVCHGAAGEKNDGAIELEDPEPLRAAFIEALPGFKALCEANRPLVFLNSCSTGQLVPSLVGNSGFPRSFGNIGANAIIAPLWPVEDKLASEVAVEIYEEALKPGAKPIAEILRQIRRRGYEAEDADTYAAYCFFGDPQARLELLNCADR